MSRPVFEPRFARVAAAIADPTRARILARLLDGRLHTAGELARHAGVSAATMSSHLKLLVEEGLATSRPQGRHRYFRLADASVAHALEALQLVAHRAEAPGASRWQRESMRGLRQARSCYGHLAGVLGVELHDVLRRKGWVCVKDNSETIYTLTSPGKEGLMKLGLMPAALDAADRGPSRPLYSCVDWSERRDHFAGPLAVALLDFFIAEDWLSRRGDSRELAMTPKGHQAWRALISA